LARMLAAEMHSGFSALRTACPMNLRVAYTDFPMTEAVHADLTRIEALWDFARTRFAKDSPWLFGAYSVADVFFAPVAGRIAGYGLKVGDTGATYVAAHLAHPSFRRWRAMGMVDGDDQPNYWRDFARGAWPGPTPLAAQAVASGPSVNTACPYSGDPVTHYLSLSGKTYGFCNAFCRDKTVADAEAWPKFMALVAAQA
ncbi:MAG: glutathione S-transferase, partial [Paracoccaceae bacterium]|nr:glutathione S-transferase [Paracoccaceae bacterium]